MVLMGNSIMRIFRLTPLLLALSLPLVVTPVSAAEKDKTVKPKEHNKRKPSKYHSLPKKEQEKIRKIHKDYSKMPPEKQRKLREQWQKQKTKKRK